MTVTAEYKIISYPDAIKYVIYLSKIVAKTAVHVHISQLKMTKLNSLNEIKSTLKKKPLTQITKNNH